VQLYTRALRGEAGPEQVLRALAARARRRGAPPPAALTGDWFGGSAVLAPSVRIVPVGRERAFSALDDLPEVAGPDGPAPEGAVGGGWVGFLGYDLGADGQLPPAAWGWADHVLRRDREDQWWFESLGEPDPQLVGELADLVTGAHGPRRTWTAGPVAPPDAERHRKAVSACVEEIAAGEIFQANICSRFRLPFDGDPVEVFAAGSERFHPARAAYVAGGWGAVASLSPELFLARAGAVARSCPIKGTLPRRGARDDANAQRLRRSTKDVAENVMIVDMARNDLGRVAEPGKVTTPHLLDVQPHPGVWHLVSEVRAELPDGTSHADLLRATYPPASVTGTPKVRALEIIDELEDQPREVYCGAVGMVSPAAGLQLNVAIRTLECTAGTVQFGVGGGITADSDPEGEWQECLTKAAPLLSLLEGQPRAASTAS
jgi:para-aminobenzoate synthetase component 1